MNRFHEFNNGYHKLVHEKHSHYLDIYDRHFKKFVGKNPKLLEIGVRHGGSIEM